MREIEFAWDERKSRLNRRKHGVSFEEAKTVFYDENAIQFPDPDHSEQEDRFLMLGVSYRLRARYDLNDSLCRPVTDGEANGKCISYFWTFAKSCFPDV